MPFMEDHQLSDELESIITYEPATNWQRLANLLIDNIVMNLTIDYAISFIVTSIAGSINPDWVKNFDKFDDLNAISESLLPLLLISFLIGLINTLLYYTLSEKALRGQTLGKMITGTRAIRVDGGELSFKDAFLRSLVRLVPFEVLSIFFQGKPWHDEWTKTTVIKSRK
ncbi:MAG: RDD family protein [Pedobacter sp.]|nr:MAG: RDD family protein [Pedobacter sp.]